MKPQFSLRLFMIDDTRTYHVFPTLVNAAHFVAKAADDPNVYTGYLSFQSDYVCLDIVSGTIDQVWAYVQRALNTGYLEGATAFCPVVRF